ncbi:MAG: AIR synthase-related protein [Bacteriovoracaceae bacterium]
MNIYRFDIFPLSFVSKKTLEARINNYSPVKAQDVCASKTYWLETKKELSQEELAFIGKEILTDPVIEDFSISPDKNQSLDFEQAIQVSFKPGVQDNRANSVKKALELFFPKENFTAYSGDLYFLKGDLSKADLKRLATEFLSNSLLHNISCFLKDEFIQDRFKDLKTPKVEARAQEVEVVDFTQSLEKLNELNQQRVWALSLEELKVIQDHYTEPKTTSARKKAGLCANPTDVEVEIIAQTWSEHCKHKIFAAHIEYKEVAHPYAQVADKMVEGIYKNYIKKSTREIKQERGYDWLISVFSDNAGIVRFDDNIDLCIKVETHNSPSALDPYGGALTGILGVNRDILGTGMGAKPIANMDVFCFAHESILQKTKLPKGLLHPKRILEGVHRGVEDGGNKSGIPTVNGSIFFDDQYVGKPLVYVGTVGAMPQSTKHYPKTSEKNYRAGDRVVMVGGRIGKDGIHGATFSSMELNENAPATAVQIGDPFTQKKVTDFMLKARDLGLYSGVTDNGAGGLSSSIGEMAQISGGAIIDLALAPVKYEGLSPYELMISESQERMSFAVPREKARDFIQLAASMEVEATDLGEFTQDGQLKIYFKENLVADLNMEFLHEGLPPMKLKAKFDPLNNPHVPWHKNSARKTLEGGVNNWLKELLQRPNIRSKEDLVRQYDHEVLAASAIKPFTGKTQSGPSDAGVIALKNHGGSGYVAIGNGNQPLYSHFDPYLMALHSVDEAVRNVVASGGDPDKLVLLDNFCWPDPLPGKNNPDAEHKLAGLVRANEALYKICKIYGAPLVSGKDSMKNDFSGADEHGNPVKISVPPTLLATSMAKVQSKKHLTTTNFKRAGDWIYLLGKIENKKYLFSEFARLFDVDAQVNNIQDDELKIIRQRYQDLHSAVKEGLIQSCHDISEGGLISAVCECCFGDKLGADLQIDSHETALLVNEGLGLLVVSVKEKDQKAFETKFSSDCALIGKTKKEYQLGFSDEVQVELEDMFNAWRGQS